MKENLKIQSPLFWIRGAPVIFLLLGLFHWPYGYYTVLRIVVCGCCSFIAYKSFRGGVKFGWIITFGLIAILFNPFVPIHLTREIWTWLNILTVFYFIVHWKAFPSLDDDFDAAPASEAPALDLGDEPITDADLNSTCQAAKAAGIEVQEIRDIVASYRKDLSQPMAVRGIPQEQRKDFTEKVEKLVAEAKSK